MSNQELIKAIQSQIIGSGEGIDEDTRAVAGTAFGKRLSIKGGVFRKFEGGKEVAAIEDRHLNIIFVKMAHTPSRNFYSKAYVEGENISPDCWSSDTKTPDLSVKAPVAKNCVDCPKSVKGSSADGNGTACRLSWRTAVVLPNDPGGDILQLVLPSTSVFGKEENQRWPFRAYIQMLAGNSISAGRVITKMQFDTKSATPKLLFSPVSAVPPEDVAVVLSQSKSDTAAACVELKVFEPRKEAEAPPSALPPVAAVVSPMAPVQEAEPEPEPVPEPVLRKAKADAAPVSETDVSEIIKKWASKKAQ